MIDRLYHSFRPMAGIALLVGSMFGGLITSGDVASICSAITAIALAGTGAYMVVEQRRLKAKKVRDESDRQERLKVAATNIRIRRAEHRAETQLILEREKAIAPTLQKKIDDQTHAIDDLTRALEDAKVEAVNVKAKAEEIEQRAAEERAAMTRELLAMREQMARAHETLNEIDRKVDQKKRILVVDDNADICSLLVRFFKDLGFDAECAKNLKDARRKFTGRCYWVLVDVGLPDGSGIELLKYIKGLGVNVRVAVITGAGDATIDEADRAQADMILQKPIDFDLMWRDMRAMDDFAPRNKIDVPATKHPRR